jgi:hypothetical protein
MFSAKEKLQKSIGGIKDMGGVPDAIFVIDVGYHKRHHRSRQAGHPGHRRGRYQPLARRRHYVIPGNDDSAKASRCTLAAWLTPCWKAAPTPSTTSSKQSGRRIRRSRAGLILLFR